MGANYVDAKRGFPPPPPLSFSPSLSVDVLMPVRSVYPYSLIPASMEERHGGRGRPRGGADRKITRDNTIHVGLDFRPAAAEQRIA